MYRLDQIRAGQVDRRRPCAAHRSRWRSGWAISGQYSGVATCPASADDSRRTARGSAGETTADLENSSVPAPGRGLRPFISAIRLWNPGLSTGYRSVPRLRSDVTRESFCSRKHGPRSPAGRTTAHACGQTGRQVQAAEVTRSGSAAPPPSGDPGGGANNPEASPGVLPLYGQSDVSTHLWISISRFALPKSCTYPRALNSTNARRPCHSVPVSMALFAPTHST